MDAQSILNHARDILTVKRVFGEPIERDGVTVIPVANVRGGLGFGSGDSDVGGHASGGGGGLGVSATPAGVYIIEGSSVRWEAAMNPTLIAIGGQITGIIALLVIRSMWNKWRDTTNS
jgi:uncharacterized spore protein YtfJ